MDVMASDKTQKLIDTRATLTVNETAAVLNISRSSVYNRIADGTLPSLRMGGRVVVPAEGLRRLLQD